MESFDRGGASGDQGGVDRVVFSPLQPEHRIGTDLMGLKVYDFGALRAQLAETRALVPAARLDSDTFDAVLLQPGRQARMAGLFIVELETIWTTVDRGVEFVFSGVNSGAHKSRLAHLLRPCIVNANQVFQQPYGSNEEPKAIWLTNSPKGYGGDDPTFSVRFGRPPEPDVLHRTSKAYRESLIQGGKRPSRTITRQQGLIRGQRLQACQIPLLRFLALLFPFEQLPKKLCVPSLFLKGALWRFFEELSQHVGCAQRGILFLRWRILRGPDVSWRPYRVARRRPGRDGRSIIAT